MTTIKFQDLGTGWRPEEPHVSHHTLSHPSIQELFDRPALRAYRRRAHERPPPAAVDLREWVPAVRFQGGFNTCAAHVVAAILEFFEKKSFGRSVDTSRLFLYKVAKNFLQEKGDPGVYIRQTMGVLRTIGVPPEKYWPYVNPGTLEHPNKEDIRLDEEPAPFCYALAADFKAVSYYRIDGAEEPGDGERLLRRAKQHVASRIPITLGFPLMESLGQASESGEIPYPADSEKQLGSHAVVVCGYDDAKRIRNQIEGGPETVGAFLIQNSWSKKWGSQGYGWLPYEYLVAGRSSDLWTLTRAEWIDTGQFQLDLSD